MSLKRRKKIAYYSTKKGLFFRKKLRGDQTGIFKPRGLTSETFEPGITCKLASRIHSLLSPSMYHTNLDYLVTSVFSFLEAHLTFILSFSIY